MIALAHRRAFWFGIAAVSAGVVLHLPMYIGAADMGYELAGRCREGGYEGNRREKKR